MAWIGRAAIERVDSLRCVRAKDDGAEREPGDASREGVAKARAETDDDATFARLVAIHRPEPHIMLFKRKKSEE